MDRPRRTTTAHDLPAATVASGRLTRFTWLAVWTLVLVDLVWMALKGWTVQTQVALVIPAAVAGLMSPLVIARFRRDPRLRSTLPAVALALVFMPASAVLSYLVVSTNFPLVDTEFARWDAALGFDWHAWDAYVRSHPLLQMTLRVAYFSGFPQYVVIIMLCGFSGRIGRVYELVALMVIVSTICILVSGLWPAAGPWKHYGAGTPSDLAMLSHFEPLREGKLTLVFAEPTQGLVSMPSFHAASGVLYAVTLRDDRRLVWPAVLLNGLMIVSTPTVGGHYLVDVIAGVVMAVAAILMLDRVGRPNAATGYRQTQQTHPQRAQ